MHALISGGARPRMKMNDAFHAGPVGFINTWAADHTSKEERQKHGR